jgi:hypothetical protein
MTSNFSTKNAYPDPLKSAHLVIKLSFKFLFYSLFAVGPLVASEPAKHCEATCRQQMTRIFQKAALIHSHTTGKRIKLTNCAQLI